MKSYTSGYPKAPTTTNQELLDTYSRAIEGDTASQYTMG